VIRDTDMPQLFGRTYTRQQISDLTGDMSQVAALRRTEYVEGPERGAGLIEVFNASGLCFSLLPGRALDIASAHYKGMSLGFRSSTGNVGPGFYEPEGFGWLRGFFGGLLATCGMTFVGHPETDAEEENEALGLHGRISYTPAREIGTRGFWDGEDYLLEVTGTMREAVVFGTDLKLTRRITTVLGEPTLRVEDRIENQATASSPLMFLYHMNPGFPVLDVGARFLFRSERSTEWEENREIDPKICVDVGALADEHTDNVYVHRTIADTSGTVEAALVNDGLGMGIAFRWPQSEMPLLTQWQHYTKGTFVMGIEPGNCSPLGRAWNRANGSLESIAPGEVKRFNMEITVLDGAHAIAEAEKRVEGDL